MWLWPTFRGSDQGQAPLVDVIHEAPGTVGSQEVVMAVKAWGQLYVGDEPPAEDPVIVGSVWVDTANGLLKRCSSTDPYTWVTAEGGEAGAHAETHQHGGDDEVATDTPGANVIPKAGAGGKLAAGFLQEVLAHADLTDAPAEAHQDLVTLGAGSAPELTLDGQELILAAVLTPTEHTDIGDNAPHHAAITLAADAQELLSLVAQELGFVAKAANLVLAGPVAGAAADPTFRALVDADVPAAVMRDQEHTDIGDNAPHHAPVSLGETSDPILGLEGQELTLGDVASRSDIVPQIPPLAVDWCLPGWFWTMKNYNTLNRTDRIMYIPIHLSHETTFDAMGIDVNVSEVDKTMRIGIYEYDVGAQIPGALVVDAGTVSLGETGIKTLAIDETLAPGWYVIAYVSDATSAKCVGPHSSYAASPPVYGYGTSPMSGTYDVLMSRPAQNDQLVNGLSDPAVEPTYGESFIYAHVALRAA